MQYNKKLTKFLQCNTCPSLLKTVVGAAMRKPVHLIYGIVKSGIPFDAHFGIENLDLQDGI
ncbi:hypothetical protein HA050_03715 [Iodobacter sp. HSC-16F04]|uniref:Uncharacterized protein n=1 Tax=Iodobacter violaceini TaxID=3044271 RepID=A0ABX0KNB8_9NEIS|nr:hypothetical protein [Iodobacter violacea]NHQ85217.1 hypothetical protein [Iodobacter violacea]